MRLSRDVFYPDSTFGRHRHAPSTLAWLIVDLKHLIRRFFKLGR